MDYTFQDEDDSARRRTWIGATAFALAIVIGAILLLRAAGRGNQAGRAEPDAPAAAETPAPQTGNGKASETKQREGAAPSAPPKSPRLSPAIREPAPESQADNSRDATPPKTPPPSGEKPAPAGANARALLAKGQDAERADDLAAARSAYEAALASPDLGEARALVESRLGAVMVALVTSQREMPEKIEHAIASGDRIVKLAISHGTTVALITKSNNISNPGNIRLGDRLRILDNPKFEILVSKSGNWLLLKMNGKFFKRYVVGTGKFNRTPVGTFKITDKEENPAWWKDNRKIPFGDPENILGTRWMKIEATGQTPPASGYGIHGTWDNSSLGQQSSAGCVRMANSDVEELFMLVPKGTPVTIED